MPRPFLTYLPLLSTGAQVQSISDDTMSIFAPNRDVMEEVMEKIEDIISEDPNAQVRWLCLLLPWLHFQY